MDEIRITFVIQLYWQGIERNTSHPIFNGRLHDGVKELPSDNFGVAVHMYVCVYVFVSLCVSDFDKISSYISMWLHMLAHAITVTTRLTAVHFLQGGDPCIAVLVHSSRALYVRAAQGQTRRSKLKLHHWAHLSLVPLCSVTLLLPPFFTFAIYFYVFLNLLKQQTRKCAKEL